MENFYTGNGFKELMKNAKILTFDEYKKLMDKWEERVRTSNDEMIERHMRNFQMKYMEGVLEDYKKRATTQAQKEIYELLDYAVHNSTSGNAIHYVSTKELVDEIDEIIWREIGEYMLDGPEIYQDGDGDWAIDCMFGGNYIPLWDGWDED